MRRSVRPSVSLSRAVTVRNGHGYLIKWDYNVFGRLQTLSENTGDLQFDCLRECLMHATLSETHPRRTTQSCFPTP